MKFNLLAGYFIRAIAVQVANQRGVRLIQLVLFCRVGVTYLALQRIFFIRATENS